MRAKIQRWGNSLAVRIPKPVAEAAGLEPQSAVEISLVKGSLVVTPCPKPARSLEELLAQVTDENLHGEVDTGSPVGREIW
ncbi:MAG TPA: AbrB/MazE/SpoVT family DNA-binding domain-containing protein [Thermoanaerobaculia bacterium]|jgi:antitoxin MazE